LDPSEKAVAKKNDGDSSIAATNSFGVGVVELSDARRRELNIHGGVEVQNLGDGPLARVGVRVGDIIVRVGNIDISGVKQFESVVKSVPKGKAVAVFIRRSDTTIVVPVKTP
jgi:serine protease Do